MDREIGRVLAQLRAMGRWTTRSIFFLSDNGASAEIMVRGDGHDPHAECGTGATFLSIGPGWSSLANTPFRRHKTWVHEGGISTPLIVHWPKGIAARGELRHTPGHIIDLVPTILEAAGGKPTRKVGRPARRRRLPGRACVPLFAKDGTVAHDSLWWLHEGNRALRVGDWKIVAAGKDSPWELYDLSSDRSETKNLAEGQAGESARTGGDLDATVRGIHGAGEKGSGPQARRPDSTVAVALFPPHRRLSLRERMSFRGAKGDTPVALLLPLALARRLHVQDLHQERLLVGQFLDHLRRRLARPVAGLRLDARQHRRIARLAVLQHGRELEAVARHHAVVGVGRRHQRRRILCSLLQVVIRRISVQRLELLRVVATSRSRRPRSGPP